MGIYDEDKLLNAAEQRVKDAEYHPDTKEAIIDFENFLFLEGASSPRVRAYISQIHMYATWLKDIPLPDATITDIKRFLG